MSVLTNQRTIIVSSDQSEGSIHLTVSLKVVGSVVQIIELVVSLQDSVNVVPHNPHHLLDLDTEEYWYY